MIFCKTFLALAQFIEGIEMKFIFGFTPEEEKVFVVENKVRSFIKSG